MQRWRTKPKPSRIFFQLMKSKKSTGRLNKLSKLSEDKQRTLTDAETKTQGKTALFIHMRAIRKSGHSRLTRCR